ncbi:MBL fold metallo-hydrolase [Deinococcus yavapaiensis]|uniref:Ribonuclease Z n=1 Tax=Deinococcus yavapaiensis KR-236 TaxID=694435 RepID=A0A318SA29_9DEIO|nr:MBL fold metallo-hydrolase [Deinococcus yavapaiensis]PYE56209.1 ribonuclease Z [Deinococcus yavapaiensis KR-236]
MGLDVQVLGGPSSDNALFVRVNTGRATHRLLFDVGQGVLDGVARPEVTATDHLFFSHFHMDHVAGFDAFLRVNAARERPVHVWGPPRTSEFVHHRLRGVMWNLAPTSGGDWLVSDVDPPRVRAARFALPERFETRHDLGERLLDGPLVSHADFTVEVRLLDHRTPSAAYLVREAPRVNVDAHRLAAMNLAPGPWLARLKNGESGLHEGHDLAALRTALLTQTPGASVAYLTDLRLDDDAHAALTPWLSGVTTLVCESQYRHDDADLAALNHHVTSVQAARLARDADVRELVLFHVSDRYDGAERAALLQEARAIFPATRFPDGW